MGACLFAIIPITMMQRYMEIKRACNETVKNTRVSRNGSFQAPLHFPTLVSLAFPYVSSIYNLPQPPYHPQGCLIGKNKNGLVTSKAPDYNNLDGLGTSMTQNGTYKFIH